MTRGQDNHGGIRLGALWPHEFPLDPPVLADIAVVDLVQDSRRVRPGVAFVALSGIHGHGLDHSTDAAARGAAVILWDEADAAPAVEVPCVHLPGLRARLPELAKALFGTWPEDYPIVAVTGTDGKTTVTHLLARALEALGTPTGVIGTLGVGRPGALVESGHTTPGLIDMQRHLATLAASGCRAVALEASSHGLVQGRLEGVSIQVAVLTRLGSDHLDFHGSQAEYAEAKARLFAWPGLAAAVLNVDDTLGRELAARPACPAHVWRYSALGAAADLSAHDVAATPEGIRFTLAVGGRRLAVQSPLFGLFQVGNLLATLAALHALDVEWEPAVAALQNLPGVPGRMERFQLPGDILLVVDYAHTGQALEAALAALRPHTRGRLLVVFGCGGDRDAGKRPAMGRVACEHADAVYLTDDNPRHEDPAAIRAAVLAGCHRPAACREVADRGHAIRAAVADARPGDVVLVAGKGHETTQQVGDDHLPFSDRELAGELASGRAASARRGDSR